MAWKEYVISAFLFNFGATILDNSWTNLGTDFLLSSPSWTCELILSLGPSWIFFTFPWRNKLMSALGLAEKTVDNAVCCSEQSLVFSLPQNITSFCGILLTSFTYSVPLLYLPLFPFRRRLRTQFCSMKVLFILIETISGLPEVFYTTLKFVFWNGISFNKSNISNAIPRPFRIVNFCKMSANSVVQLVMFSGTPSSTW